jgi:hypothetical protein
MAGTVWALFMTYKKYIINIIERIVTKKKVPLEFEITDIEIFKKISLITTLAFLIVRINSFGC